MSNPIGRPSFAAFTYTFVPFSTMLVVGNLAAEMSQNLPLYRSIYSIWACFALALPALCIASLFNLKHAPGSVYHYWRLFWTFSYLAYLVHFWFSVWGFFEGDIKAIYERQGILVAGTNFLLATTWGLEVFIAWIGCCRSKSAFYVYQCANHLLFVIAMITSSVVFKSGFVWWLGLVLTIFVGGCLVLRLLCGDASDACSTAKTRQEDGGVNLFS